MIRNRGWGRMFARRGKKRRIDFIEPDEIFLDSSNLPDFDRDQFEGHIERPIAKRSLVFFGLGCFLVALLFVGKVWSLQITHGAEYIEQSENNRLDHTLIFADRGVIYDRLGERLAWNERTQVATDFAGRVYKEGGGLGHLLGYVTYPLKDTAGFYFQESFLGKDGAERIFDSALQGEN